VRILITGADSFIGKNLKAELVNRKYNDILEINSCYDKELLMKSVEESDFIFHLLTVYRSEDSSEFEYINTEITRMIVKAMKEKQKTLLLLSSTQAENDNDYGRSKLKAEECVQNWVHATGNKAFIFRLSNEFGKWCPPNLNSVVATFCYNIANGLNIQINNPTVPLKLMYIDDIIDKFVSVMEKGSATEYCEVDPIYIATVGEVADILQSFKAMRTECNIPGMENRLIKKLYSTYLSYLSTDGFSIPINTHVDDRGSFSELLHFGGMGQVSVNISKPGITKGNHWHHTKNEKFIVISGEGMICFRKVDECEIIKYHVSGAKMEVLDIPPGYTHNITNTGLTDMITIMWANEIFDNNKPDTYFEEV